MPLNGIMALVGLIQGSIKLTSLDSTYSSTTSVTTLVGLINENRPISKTDIKDLVDTANGKNAPDTFFGFAEKYIKGPNR